MSHFKTPTLDQISFENVSVMMNGIDPVLRSVDFNIPMDQTILVQSSNPNHAVYFLEILAGRKIPESGRIFWNDNQIMPFEDSDWSAEYMVGCYFENQRPSPEDSLKKILDYSKCASDLMSEVIEHFELKDLFQQSFKKLTYENQKLSLLILATLKNPQMLILEDPALGLSEKVFLEFLDWVQRGQRQGYFRHIFMTNNHPAALRHLESSSLFIDDGLIYFEENQKFKKVFHF